MRPKSNLIFTFFLTIFTIFPASFVRKYSPFGNTFSYAPSLCPKSAPFLCPKSVPCNLFVFDAICPPLFRLR